MIAAPTLTPAPLRSAAADPSRLWRALGLPSQRAAAPQPIFEPRRSAAFHELVGVFVGPQESVLCLCVDARSGAPVAGAGAGEGAGEGEAAPATAAQAREERRQGLLLEAVAAVTGAADEAAGEVDAIPDPALADAGVRALIDLLDRLDRAVPPGLDVHLIVDRRASCRSPEVRAWFQGRRRFHVHFARDHRRWRERALTWLRFAARRQRVLGAPRSTLLLESAMQRFVRRAPAGAVFTWTRSGDELLTLLARFLVRRGA